MKRPFIATALFVCFCSSSFADEESLLKVVPRNTRGSLSVRNLDAVREKGDKLIAELGPKDRFAFTFSRMVDMALDFMQIKTGVDRTGTFSLIAADWGKKTDSVQEWEYLVLRIPYSDADEMAANWKLPAGSLVNGEILEVESKLSLKTKAHLGVDDDAVYLGFLPNAVRSVLDSEKLSAATIDDEADRIDQADLLFHLHVPAYLQDPAERERVLKGFLEPLSTMTEDDNEKLRGLAREVLLGAEEFFIAVRLDRGLHLRTQVTISDSLSDAAKQMLADWGRSAAEPTLDGLPTGNLLVSVARSANRGGYSDLGRSLVEWIFEHRILYTTLRESYNDLIEPARDTLLGVFDEVFNSLEESRIGVYLTDDPNSQGLMTLLAVIKPTDRDEFQRTLRDILKYARGTEYNPETKAETAITDEDVCALVAQLGDPNFRTRSAATLKLKLLGDPAIPHLRTAVESTDREIQRRSEKLLQQIQTSVRDRQRILVERGIPDIPTPTFVLYPAHETLGGFQVDLIEARWKVENEQQSGLLKEWLGPRGREILMVHAGSRVVFCLGSDRELLTRCLEGIRDGDEELESHAALFRNYDSPARNAEMHFSLQRMRTLVPDRFPRRNQPEPGPPTNQMSSVGIEISPRHLRSDFTVPVDELRVMARIFGIW